MRFKTALFSCALMTILTGCIDVYKIPAESLDDPSRSPYYAQQQARAAEQQRQEALQQQKINQYYQSNNYGEKVSCSVRGGTVDFKPGWRAYRPFAFTLVPTESKSVYVTDEKGRKNNNIWVSLDESGQMIMFCPTKPTSSYSQRDCRQVTGSYNEMSRGMTLRLNAPEIIRDARLSCSFAGGRGAPGMILMR